jgi:hypothetical protein
VPPNWLSSTLPNAVATYQTVVARNCRTCHAALPTYNWDASPQGFAATAGCVYGAVNNSFIESMPNSLVTFNRFHSSSQVLTLYNDFISGAASAYCLTP